MNLSETAKVLAQMQAYDQRTVGESDVHAWQAILADASFEDCQEAVFRYYSGHVERMMPAHVRRLVGEFESERQKAARKWAPGQAGVRPEDALPEIASGERMALKDLPEAVAALVARVRADLPEGSRESLKPRTVAWEREQKAFLRTQDAKPNPLYRPNPHKAPLADDSGAPTDEGSDEKPEVIGSLGYCKHPGHPVTSHLCESGGVPYGPTFYKLMPTDSNEGYRFEPTSNDTGILPNAYRCAGCTFVTADRDRMNGHLNATGHEGA